MKNAHLFLSLVLGLSDFAFGLEPASRTNSVQTILPNILAAEHDCHEFMRDASVANKWSPEDCSDLLLLAQDMLKDSTDGLDAYRRENAIVLLGEFGSTNALDGLSELIASETGLIKEFAATSYLLLTKADPSKMSVIKENLDRSPCNPMSFSSCLYRRIDARLRFPDGDSVFRKNLLRLLLDRATEDAFSGPQLDEILCREVPKWRASPQRAENAARMIHEHPDDARLVAFFETVRTNALESARAESRASPDASTTRAVPTDAESDPWADLLSDLPEKKPWTPPTDGVLSN